MGKVKVSMQPLWLIKLQKRHVSITLKFRKIANMKILALFLICVQLVCAKMKIDTKELKCLVCEKTVEEMEAAVNALDPDITIDAGGYRLDAEGNVRQKKVPQSKSEIYLSDILDKVCDKMDDYVRATWKTSGKLTLLKLIGSDGKMSSDMDKVDIIQDSDLNKSLKYYCEGLIEEHEDAILKNFVNSDENLDIKICSLEANYCSKTLPQDDYHNDEL